MFERYTEKARRVIFFARYEASMFGSDSIGPEHVLLGIAREEGAWLGGLLGLKNPTDQLRAQIEARLIKREVIETRVELPLAQETKRVLAYAHEEGERLQHQHIGTGHMLLGLLRMGGTVAETLLRERGLSLERAREVVADISGETARPRGDSSGPGAAAVSPDEPGGRSVVPVLRVEHIGIATHSIEEALGFWRDALGLEVKHTETVEEQGVRVAMLPAGEPRIELLEPTGDDSPVAKFLARRGPGIHHVAVRVPDIRAALARLKGQGAKLIDAEPRVGAGGCLVAFVHPQSAGGVLLELVEHTPAPKE